MILSIRKVCCSWATVLAIGLLSWFLQGHVPTHAATVDRYWEVSPYRIQLLLDYRLNYAKNQRLRMSLPGYLDTRTKIAVGPLWRLSISTLADASSTLKQDQLAVFTEQQLRVARSDYDKIIVVRLQDSTTGYQALAQQYDCLLQTWGQVWKMSTRSLSDLDELAFQTTRLAYCPMVTFKVVREDPTQVQMQLRGGGLPRLPHTASLVDQGDIFRPYLRRVDRTGQPVENGIQIVPWTYLRTNESTDSSTSATIVSHTPMPMGVRQRGRVDQVGMLVRPGNRTTRLRLHAREDEDQPLAGFRVYQRDAGSEEGDFVGKTHEDGTIEISHGSTPIQIAYVQSSGKWIAKIPLVPGADGTVDAPLIDDTARQQAEAKLVAIRETLIDFVARRNILASRARLKIKANDIAGASSLISELENIPSATAFDQRWIRPQQRLIQSKDPRVQQRITTLFNNTRDVLAEFLAPGLTQELKRELAGATASNR